jgi:DNA-binding MarR family transcriptional regulator
MRFRDLEKNPGYQLWLTSNAWQRTLRRALDPMGLTHVQFVMLASIDLQGEELSCVTQAEIARFAGADENMTSQVIRTLADRRLVNRIVHPSDARARCLELTEAGKSLLDEARSAVKPASQHFFDTLGDRRELLADLLREVGESQDET